MSLIDNLRNSKNKYQGNASSNVNINVGKGDANISVRGNDVKINTGTGNQNILVLGNDIDIKLDQNADLDWDSSKDEDTVVALGKGDVSIDTGDGNDTALAVGDDVDIKMGDGNHLVGYWGNQVDIDLGDGEQHGIFSMDRMFDTGMLSENTMFLGDNIGKEILDLIGDLYLTGVSPLNLKAQILVKEAGHAVHTKVAQVLKNKLVKI